jgi:hypothetical protein
MSQLTGLHAEYQYESLDYAATLAKLADLVGREVLAELRIGSIDGPFRLAAKGVLMGTPPRQAELTRRRMDGDDIETFMLDSGGFLTLKQDDFVGAEWHAGDDEGQFSAQPRLNIAFTDSVLHVAVAWRRDRVAAAGL